MAYHQYVPPNFDAAYTLETRYQEAQRLQSGWFCTETGDNDVIASVADKYFQRYVTYQSGAPTFLLIFSGCFFLKLVVLGIQSLHSDYRI